MNLTDKSRKADFLWQYIWIAGIAIISLLIHEFKDNNIIQIYGPRLVILFLGLFLGIKYISKVENENIKEVEQKRFLNQIGPILTARLKFDMIQILDILYKMRFLALTLEGDAYLKIFCNGVASSEIDCNTLSDEFKRVSKILSEAETSSTDKIYLYKNLIRYYNDIDIYLKEIQNSIIPLVFMHSENANHINLFINFNGNVILIKQDIIKLDRGVNSHLLLSFSQLFENFSRISQEIICTVDGPKDVSINNGSTAA